MYFVFVPLAHIAYFDETYQLKDLLKGVPEVKEYEIVTFSLQGFHVQGMMRVTATAPSILFPKKEIHSVTSFGERAAATVVIRPLGRDDGPSVDMTSELNTHLPDATSDQLLEYLDLIAQSTNRNVDFVVTNKRIVAPTGTKRRLRVVLGSPPPGYSTIRDTETLFQIPVSNRGYTIGIPTPAVDAGVVVRNILDEPVAQIVGDTIYLLLSVHPSSFEGLGDGGMFKLALMLAWNTYYTEQPAAPSFPHIDLAEDFATCTLSTTKERKVLTEELAAADEDIDRAQVRLRHALAKKRKLVTKERTFLDQMARVDYQQGWIRLQTCPYFDFATTTSDQSVHYFTKPLTLKDDMGMERYLGRFGIRLHGEESVTVWSLDYPHSSDIPHPHINASGGVCLGNVTESLWQLLDEYKEAEAAVLVMRLLAEGYESSLTEHKIEEWPTVKTYLERKARHELVTPAPHAEPRLATPRDSLGRGVSRQLRNIGTGEGGGI